jgi:hypothetical protein
MTVRVTTGGAGGGTDTDRAIITSFCQGALAASQTNLQLLRTRQTTAVQRPVVMDRAGSIVGLSVDAGTARSGGSATFEVWKNGVATGLTTTLDATNTQTNFVAQAKDLDTFVAGDRIDVRVTTDASWAPVTANNLECAVTVQYA